MVVLHQVVWDLQSSYPVALPSFFVVIVIVIKDFILCNLYTERGAHDPEIVVCSNNWTSQVPLYQLLSVIHMVHVG